MLEDDGDAIVGRHPDEGVGREGRVGSGLGGGAADGQAQRQDQARSGEHLAARGPGRHDHAVSALDASLIARRMRT